MAEKKRKIDAECRVFKCSWTEDFFVIEQNAKILCLICQETMSVCKEYNIKRHYLAKHATEYNNLKDQIRIDRVNSLKRSIAGQQSLFKIPKENSLAATKLSLQISEAIAKRGKPFSDGNFIKECLDIFTSIACPEKKTLVKNTSLSHQTVARRVDDLTNNIEISLAAKLNECKYYSLGLDESTDISDTAQLVIFVRGVTDTFDIVEEFLDLCPMKGTTTGRDILDEVRKTLKKFNLKDENLYGLTTDGAPAMTGKQKGFVSLISNEIPHEIIKHHCIIHQGQLCSKILEMKHIMEKVVTIVNFIRSKGLHHRQFKDFLSEVESEHNDVIYYSHVRWLSRAATLERFWSLLGEIKTFMKSKGKDVSSLEEPEWLNDMAFFVDMTKYLADLNLKLQGKDQLINQQFENIQAFVKKLNLLQNQLLNMNLIHFKTLSTREKTTLNIEKYSRSIINLRNEFEDRFDDFRKNEPLMKVFSNPFTIDVESVQEKFQMELIDLQSNDSLKTAYVEKDLLTFYKKYVTVESYPNIRNLALQQLSLFGSTYTCEQFFSRMKNVKTENRACLTDGHLAGVLRIGTSNISADIDFLCKQKNYQISH